MKKKNVTRKTVRKRHRLARELEAANPVRNNRPGNVYWDGTGGHTIGEMMVDFLSEFILHFPV